MQNYLVTYLRKKNIPYACLYVMKAGLDDLHFGWSMRDKHDPRPFSKKFAKMVARNRAEGYLSKDDKQWADSLNLLQASHGDSAHWLPRDIAKALPRFAERAVRYFRVEEIELNDAEKALAQDKQMINSIKAIRARTGAGLKESKDAYDKYMASVPPKQPVDFSTVELNEEEKGLCRLGDWIKAIKALRFRYREQGMGLKTAKEIVEKYQESISPKAMRLVQESWDSPSPVMAAAMVQPQKQDGENFRSGCLPLDA